MMLDVLLAVVGVLGVLVAVLSVKLSTWPVSAPLLGLVAGIALGPEGVAVMPLPLLGDEQSMLHTASRMLLAISVMAVAVRYPVHEVWRHWRSLTILLLVVMPLMAVLSGGLGMAVAGLPVASAALLGAAICPTDPVLASSVVTGKRAGRDVPTRDRLLLSVESGANDGLALPLVLAALVVAGGLSATGAAGEATWQVLGGVVLGGAAGTVAGWTFRFGLSDGTACGSATQFFTIVLALGIVGGAGLLRMDGVLAVFVGGLVFSLVGAGAERRTDVAIDEGVNQFAVLPVFVLFGAVVPWQQWIELGWRGPALVVGVLVLRRVPVILLLKTPLRLRLPDALYVGWFGPVGVSALFYLTVEADRLAPDSVVLALGSMTVACSTVVFAITGIFGPKMFRTAAEQRGDGEPRPHELFEHSEQRCG